jgi:S-adenosyl methyltransferase
VPDFDTSVPHIARIYDYWLGGKDNFAADREAAERAMAATPTIVPGVRANRRFLGRTVQYMAEAGIRQFLDIGTGIPTAHNTHEVAQAVAPGRAGHLRDNDPIVLSHARALLTSTTAPTAYIDADARDTAKILAEAAELLDADEPYQLVADLMDAVPPGSFLAVTHPARDQVDIATKAEESLTESIGQKVTFRTREQVSRFFTGLELADPGGVPIGAGGGAGR